LPTQTISHGLDIRILRVLGEGRAAETTSQAQSRMPVYSDAALILQSSFRHCSGIGLLPHWYGIGQNFKCGTRKSMHVSEPLGAARLKRNSPLDDASDSETSVAGRIAVAVAGRSGRTGFTQAPGCGEACPRAARKQ
jgi:hypothetical protein